MLGMEVENELKASQGEHFQLSIAGGAFIGVASEEAGRCASVLWDDNASVVVGSSPGQR